MNSYLKNMEMMIIQTLLSVLIMIIDTVQEKTMILAIVEPCAEV